MAWMPIFGYVLGTAVCLGARPALGWALLGVLPLWLLTFLSVTSDSPVWDDQLDLPACTLSRTSGRQYAVCVCVCVCVCVLCKACCQLACTGLHAHPCDLSVRAVMLQELPN